MAVTGGLLLAGSAVPIPPNIDRDYGPYGPDRFLHMVGHAGLTATLVTALDEDGRGTLGRATLAVVASTGYGICTELMQEAVPGRGFERGDVVAGFVGSVLGAMVGRRRATSVGAGVARSAHDRDGDGRALYEKLGDAAERALGAR